MTEIEENNHNKNDDSTLVGLLSDLHCSTFGFSDDDKKSTDRIKTGVGALVGLYHTDPTIFYTAAAVMFETLGNETKANPGSFLFQLANYCADQSPYLHPKNQNKQEK
jgi:hypothetical protein